MSRLIRLNGIVARLGGLSNNAITYYDDVSSSSSLVAKGMSQYFYCVMKYKRVAFAFANDRRVQMCTTLEKGTSSTFRAGCHCPQNNLVAGSSTGVEFLVAAVNFTRGT